jgi:hypothetical protein
MRNYDDLAYNKSFWKQEKLIVKSGAIAIYPIITPKKQ